MGKHEPSVGQLEFPEFDPFYQQLLASMDPAEAESVYAALMKYAPSQRNRYTEQLKNLMTLPPEQLLSFAGQLGLTTPEQEHMSWARDKHYYDLPRPNRKKYVHEIRRGLFLHLLSRIIMNGMPVEEQAKDTARKLHEVFENSREEEN